MAFLFNVSYFPELFYTLGMLESDSILKTSQDPDLCTKPYTYLFTKDNHACVCGTGVKAPLCPLPVDQNDDDVPDGPEEVYTDQNRLEPRSDDEDT